MESKVCWNCCKLACKNRDESVTTCQDKITFVQAGILDRPKVIKGEKDGK